MTGTTSRPPSTSAGRPTAMYVGLALSILATLAPLLDIATVDTLSDHVRDAYPDWGPGLVAADRNAIAIYLVVTGVLGILVWLLTIWAVTSGKRWAGVVTTIGFTAGAILALMNLTLRGGEYDVILPYAYGTLTLLPCVAGLAAVISVWRYGRPIPCA
jgi:hypothetical protein